LEKGIDGEPQDVWPKEDVERPIQAVEEKDRGKNPLLLPDESPKKPDQFKIGTQICTSNKPYQALANNTKILFINT